MADHKEETTVDTTLVKERVKSIAAIVAALYFVLNSVLSGFGVNPLPFTNEEVATAVSGFGAVVMTVVVWWRQNVMTKAAGEGHKVTTLIKTGAYEQGISPAPETVEPVTATAETTAETVAETVGDTVSAGDTAPLATADDIADAFARVKTVQETGDEG